MGASCSQLQSPRIIYISVVKRLHHHWSSFNEGVMHLTMSFPTIMIKSLTCYWHMKVVLFAYLEICFENQHSYFYNKLLVYVKPGKVRSVLESIQLAAPATECIFLLDTECCAGPGWWFCYSCRPRHRTVGTQTAMSISYLRSTITQIIAKKLKIVVCM